MFNIILHLIAFMIMTSAFYGLYLLSQKQIAHTQQSRFAWLTQHIQRYKIICFLLCIISAILFMVIYGFAVGFVVWWILATPILLIMILWLNPLKNREKSYEKGGF